MTVETEGVLTKSARRLFPNLTTNEVLAELLLERAKRNLLKYYIVARGFAAKYDTDFTDFNHLIMEVEPSPEAEQDYFDWELAVTGMDNMKKEIEQLRELTNDK
jgi:hypothetical protein